MVYVVPAPRTGYLSGIHAQTIGETAVQLGAGRARKGDAIDHGVGVVIHHKVGDHVEAGEPLFTVHTNRPDLSGTVRKALLEAHTWSDSPVKPLPLFYGVITG
jgi:pyrimidine-nucleoside phosphorylase